MVRLRRQQDWAGQRKRDRKVRELFNMETDPVETSPAEKASKTDSKTDAKTGKEAAGTAK